MAATVLMTKFEEDLQTANNALEAYRQHPSQAAFEQGADALVSLASSLKEHWRETTKTKPPYDSEGDWMLRHGG